MSITNMMRMAQMMEQQNDDEQFWEGDVEIELEKLKDHFESFLAPEVFQPGDAVVWKMGMRNKRHPYHKPMTVIEVLQQPIMDEKNSSASPYFREPLDIICGFCDEQGDFLTFFYDSRRLTKMKQS